MSELETYQDQLTSIRQDAGGLMSGLTDAQFNWRPSPTRWSMGECFEHLNISAGKLFIPGIDAAIASAERQGLRSPGPFVYSALQRWFLRLSEPPPKVRFKAPPMARPAAQKPMEAVRTEFMQWQDQLAERLRRADGLDLYKARQASPLKIWRWSLGSYIAIMLAHERRHVWQARQVRNDKGFPA